MAPETSATTTAVLTDRAECHIDWHGCIDDLARGPLGYCTGNDGPCDPDTANRADSSSRFVEAGMSGGEVSGGDLARSRCGPRWRRRGRTSAVR
ncbi:hypothetical protein ACFC0C_36380 [Streptomyces sp. NPDC056178]|uniref:hypothetical protein n=1 Tax=unclassified Streptomyces TaxID=2593676 RepID=UPI0035DDCE34